MTDVRTEAQVPTVSATLNGPTDSLEDVAQALLALNDLWATCYVLAAYYYEPDYARSLTENAASLQLPPVVPPPERLRIRKASPLWVELGSETLGQAGVVGLTFALFAYCLRHPDEIGSFFPRIVETWHDGWSAAEQARRKRELLSEAAVSGSRMETRIRSLEPGDVDQEGGVADPFSPPAV